MSTTQIRYQKMVDLARNKTEFGRCRIGEIGVKSQFGGKEVFEWLVEQEGFCIHKK